MTGYTFEDAVRDRDEAYRLLHDAMARIEQLARLDDYELGYREGGRDVAADWHIACKEAGIPHGTTYAQAAEAVYRSRGGR